MVVIERMRPQHLRQVMEHEHEMFGTESWTEGMYRDELADVWNRHYLVALDEEAEPTTVHGWAGLMVIDHTAEILTIGTVPAARRQGVARQLMDRLLAEARRRHATEVLLEVRVDNSGAQALYADYGFEQIGIRRGYYQPANVDAAVLRLAL